MISILLACSVSARDVTDTLRTPQGDRVIVRYSTAQDGDRYMLNFSTPRIIPSEHLRKQCKGNLDRLKVVVFSKVGGYGSVKFEGITPSSIMIPSGVRSTDITENFHILGECSPMVYDKQTAEERSVRMPAYIAIYEKKHTYRLVGSLSSPLNVTLGIVKPARGSAGNVQGGRATEVERIAVSASAEIEGDNSDVTRALKSIQLVRTLLEDETELPFSQTLLMEISSLRAIQDHVNDPEVSSRITEVLLDFNAKERTLKDSQKGAALAAQAEEQAMLDRQKKDEEARRQEEERKAEEKEEAQKKRTLVMIIAGIGLGVVGFIGNAVFKHLKDLKNQKSIMEMQESLARQAEHEAARRSREVVRNRAHVVINKGKGRLREGLRYQSSNTSGSTGEMPVNNQAGEAKKVRYRNTGVSGGDRKINGKRKSI